MKKLFYGLLIFASIFFVVDKVSAATSDVYDMSEWIDISEFTLPDGITEEDYNIIIYQRSSTTGYRLLYWDKNESKYSQVVNTSEEFPYTTRMNFVPDSPSGTGAANVNLVSETSNFSKEFSSSVSTNSAFVLEYVVYSNVDIYIFDSTTSSIVKWFDLSQVNLTDEPEVYIFDKYIEDYNYSKMIFEFDLSILESRKKIFDLLLNDFYVSNEIRDTILYEVEPFEIGYPYFEYTTSTGFKGVFHLKDLEGNDIISKRKMYTGKYLDTLPDDTVSLKFIVPLLDTAEYQLKVSLVTYYPFTVSFETDEEYFSTRETLVFNGKYGAIFMPKLVENNLDIMTFFSTRCIDKILVYDTYDYKEGPIEVYDDTSNNFYYKFDYSNVNYNLFFISSTSSSCLYSNIEYDTRYFDYQIVDTKYTVGTVVNPNTGETNYVDFSNTSNIVSNFDSLSSVFEFISEQLDKDSSAYLLFYDSVNVFFNTMPIDVYVLVLTVFALILLGVTLALGGWK